MVSDAGAQQLADEHGLQILNVTWEDTGRYKDSAVGPNISDMTIQVQLEEADETSVHCMPVIRFPNFSDKTADLDPGKFHLLVGNEKGAAKQRVSLEQFLKNPTLYLTDAGSWRGEGRRSLWSAKRDSKVLVSAQACFLPVPREGKATFNPVLFNYQSMAGDPAVLTILVTPEGTSTTVIDNQRDAFSEGSSWGQRLFFNENGQRASLAGQRASDYAAAADKRDAESAPIPSAEAAGQEGMNLVMLIQVPLKQRNPASFGVMGGSGFALSESSAVAFAAAPRSDVEEAVIGHGELEGAFTEIDNLDIERDERFPIRVTVQFYKATSNGVVNAADLETIKQQIHSVYEQGDAVGSLVVSGETGRVTEYDGPKVQPEGWWEDFWKRHEENTGDSREQAIEKLRKLLGRKYHMCPVSEPYLHSLLDSYTLPDGVKPRSAVKKKGWFQF